MARTLIEKIAQGLRIIPNLDRKDAIDEQQNMTKLIIERGGVPSCGVKRGC